MNVTLVNPPKVKQQFKALHGSSPRNHRCRAAISAVSPDRNQDLAVMQGTGEALDAMDSSPKREDFLLRRLDHS